MKSSVRTWAAGDAALLVQADADAGAPARLRAAILAENLHGILDTVPGAETVLVIAEPGYPGLPDLAGRLEELAREVSAGTDSANTGETGVVNEIAGQVAEIPVVYDGADLDEVAEETGLGPDEVIARHAAGDYLVGWLGF